MSINVYEIGGNLGEPVTIFASDFEQAERIYRTWVVNHRPDDKPVLPIVHVYAGKLLAMRKLLQAAADRNETGVGYWDAELGLWRIEKPEDAQAALLAPSGTSIACYRAELDDGCVYLAFAGKFEALEALLEEAAAIAPLEMKVTALSPYRLVSTMATLRDDMRTRLEGLASWSAVHGWRIAAPELATEVGDYVF